MGLPPTDSLRRGDSYPPRSPYSERANNISSSPLRRDRSRSPPRGSSDSYRRASRTDPYDTERPQGSIYRPSYTEDERNYQHASLAQPNDAKGVFNSGNTKPSNRSPLSKSNLSTEQTAKDIQENSLKPPPVDAANAIIKLLGPAFAQFVDDAADISMLKSQRLKTKRDLDRREAEYKRGKSHHDKFPAAEEVERRARDAAERDHKIINEKLKEKKTAMFEKSTAVASKLVPHLLEAAGESAGDRQELQRLKESYESVLKKSNDLQRQLDEFRKQNDAEKRNRKYLEPLEQKVFNLEVQNKNSQAELASLSIKQDESERKFNSQLQKSDRSTTESLTNIQRDFRELDAKAWSQKDLPQEMKTNLEKIEKISRQVNDLAGFKEDIANIRRDHKLACQSNDGQIKKVQGRCDEIATKCNEAVTKCNEVVVKGEKLSEHILFVLDVKENISIISKNQERFKDLDERLQQAETGHEESLATQKKLNDTLNSKISTFEKQVKTVETLENRVKESLETSSRQAQTRDSPLPPVILTALTQRVTALENQYSLDQFTPANLSTRVDTFYAEYQRFADGQQAADEIVGDNINSHTARIEALAQKASTIETNLEALQTSVTPLLTLPARVQDLQQVHQNNNFPVRVNTLERLVGVPMPGVQESLEQRLRGTQSLLGNHSKTLQAVLLLKDQVGALTVAHQNLDSQYQNINTGQIFTAMADTFRQESFPQLDHIEPLRQRVYETETRVAALGPIGERVQQISKNAEKIEHLEKRTEGLEGRHNTLKDQHDELERQHTDTRDKTSDLQKEYEKYKYQSAKEVAKAIRKIEEADKQINQLTSQAQRGPSPVRSLQIKEPSTADTVPNGAKKRKIDHVNFSTTFGADRSATPRSNGTGRQMPLKKAKSHGNGRRVLSHQTPRVGEWDEDDEDDEESYHLGHEDDDDED